MKAMGHVGEPATVALASLDDLRARIRSKSKLKGRQPDEQSLSEVRSIIGPRPSDGHRRDLLIEKLHLLNDRYNGLLKRHLVALAREMSIPMAEIFEVASFYHHFEVMEEEQVSSCTVRVCDGLACEMAGAKKLLAELPRVLGDRVQVRTAPCIGRCEQAPAVSVNHAGVPHATSTSVGAAIAMQAWLKPTHRRIADFEPAQLAQRSITPSHDEGAPLTDYARYRANGGYLLAASVARSPDDREHILRRMEMSGLRGLGGAGFPAGRKWRIVREQPGPRLMAVNVDEGEPGTFKDRTYLERDPHRFLEGIVIAARVVGVDAVYIYVRDEYLEARELLAAELEKLISDPPCPLPRIELRRGAGAYICGEESAMIESIEGKRGEPRLRPPFIAQMGLFGRPTLEHNFETLYWVRDILERGPEWFLGFGRRGRQGLRSFSVSGRVKFPGVKLAPAGITVLELIDEYCGGMQDGHDFYAYLPGGASGGILPASMGDIPLDFDTLQPHGCFIGSAAVMVLGGQDRARDAALNVMRFFADESCGQCTPCRVGTAKAAELMVSARWDSSTLDDLARVMADASICGLGQAAPNPIRCVQKYFSHEI